MKKIVTLILLMCMVLSLSACGKVEITMQEIYDANQTEVILKNHQSIYVRDEMDGEVVGEKYLTKEYVYDYFHDEEFDWMEFTADDADYMYVDGDVVSYFFVNPDGVSNDFASYRAERYPSAILSMETSDEIIESVSKKDGCITVNSFWGQEVLADMAEYGVTSCKIEYALDAKNHEMISIIGDLTYDDGGIDHTVTEVTYDAEAPETVKTFLEYANQTENLRNITVVSNPGTEKEVSQSVHVPKGLFIGFRYDDAFEGKVEFYTDAACTEAFDFNADTGSDLNVYVKWVE